MRDQFTYISMDMLVWSCYESMGRCVNVVASSGAFNLLFSIRFGYAHCLLIRFFFRVVFIRFHNFVEVFAMLAPSVVGDALLFYLNPSICLTSSSFFKMDKTVLNSLRS